MSSLPADVVQYLLSFVDVRHIVFVSLVSSEYRKTANASVVWKRIALDTTFNAPLLKLRKKLHGIDSVENWHKYFWRHARVWSRQHRHSGMAISEVNPRLVEKTDQSTWNVIRTEWPIIDINETGKYYCEFHITRDPVFEGSNGWRLICGLVCDVFPLAQPTPAKFTGLLDGRVIGYIGGCARVVSPAFAHQGTPFGSKYGLDSRVGVYVDTQASEVYFYLNGVCQGRGIANLRSQLTSKKSKRCYFGVALSQAEAQVEILPITQPPAPPTIAPPGETQVTPAQ